MRHRGEPLRLSRLGVVSPAPRSPLGFGAILSAFRGYKVAEGTPAELAVTVTPAIRPSTNSPGSSSDSAAHSSIERGFGLECGAAGMANSL